MHTSTLTSTFAIHFFGAIAIYTSNAFQIAAINHRKLQIWQINTDINNGINAVSPSLHITITCVSNCVCVCVCVCPWYTPQTQS